jgi:hypothetical protein
MSSKANQKLIYAKECSLNSTADQTITGIFKSSSNLSKSLVQRQGAKKTTEQFEKNTKSSFSTSAKLILGIERSKNINDIQIRNLSHNYEKYDNNQNTYEMLNKNNLEKRKKHLDTIEDRHGLRIFIKI